MLKYAKIVDVEKHLVIVRINDDPEAYKPYEDATKEPEFSLMDVECAYDGRWYEMGYAPKRPIDEVKADAYAALWSNYKKHQQTYVDAEDLTLAVVCASQGSAKGSAIQQWVMRLWSQYYAVKDQINSAETAEALDAIPLSAETFGAPEYTIRELNEEAAGLSASN